MRLLKDFYPKIGKNTPAWRRDELPLDFVNDKRYIINVEDYHVKKV